MSLDIFEPLFNINIAFKAQSRLYHLQRKADYIFAKQLIMQRKSGRSSINICTYNNENNQMKQDKMKEVIFLKSSKSKILEILNTTQTIDFFGLVDNQKNTPLHYAASLGYVQVVKKYLQLLQVQELWYKRYGDNITKGWIKSNIKYWLNEQNNDGLTAIHYASLKGHIQIIRLLDEAGVNLDKITNTGLNVFTIAAKQGKINSMIYFQNKVDSNMSDLKKCSAIHWAVFKGYDSIVRYLINKNFVQIDFRQQSGKTALHIAVISGHTKIVKILLLGGANRFIKDKDNKLPENYAEEQKDQKMLQILQQQQRSGCIRKVYIFRKRQKQSFLMIVLVFVWTTAIVLSNYLANLSSLLTSIVQNLEKSESFNFPTIQLAAQIVGILLFCIGSIYLYFSSAVQRKGENQREMLFMRNFMKQPQKFTQYCLSCKILREEGIVHCQICQKCVKNKIFHNHITGCCISMENLKLYIGITFILLLVLFSEFITGIITLIHLLSYNIKSLSGLFVALQCILISVDLVIIVPIIGMCAHLKKMGRIIKSKKDYLIKKELSNSSFQNTQSLLKQKAIRIDL